MKAAKNLPLLTLACLCLAALGAATARATDLTPPVVAKPIREVTVTAGAAPSIISVNNTFALQGVKTQVVRFTTSLGNIDVELYPGATPKTVANFLSYVHRGEASNGGYNYSIIQRAVPGFIVQGGGYYVNASGVEAINTQGDIPGEPGIPNTAGTIAMALSVGPNTGVNQWFFNLVDNSAKLDGTKNGGPFTVFGRVIENGMDTLSAIAGLKNYDLSASVNSDISAGFTSVPLLDTYNPANGATPKDLVYTESIAVIPLVATGAGGDALLTLKVLTNSNPKVADATLTGRKLRLTYLGKPGATRITLRAKDAAGTAVKTSFTVTVK